MKRVLEYLDEVGDRPGVDPEFFRYQTSLVKGELSQIDDEIAKLHREFPNLEAFTTEQLKQELLAVEADTYAEFVQTGRLNRELAPLLGMGEEGH